YSVAVMLSKLLNKFDVNSDISTLIPIETKSKTIAKPNATQRFKFIYLFLLQQFIRLLFTIVSKRFKFVHHFTEYMKKEDSESDNSESPYKKKLLPIQINSKLLLYYLFL